MFTQQLLAAANLKPFSARDIEDAASIYLLRHKLDGPASEEAGEDESGLLDLPVTPDEGTDPIPEDDRPVPT